MLHCQPKHCTPTNATNTWIFINIDSGRWKPDGDKGECGKSISQQDRTGRVVGGRRAKLGQFPWMVLIGYNPPQIPGDDIFYVCGGTLINKHYVLTAATCINTENGDPM